MSEQSGRCRAATEAAMDAALEECGSEEAVKEQIGRVLGSPELFEENEVAPECPVVLEEGVTEDVLQNHRRTRQYVFCRAWKLVNSEDESIPAALEQSWAEVHAEADKLGIEV